MSALPKLTDRQRARLDEIEAELRERYNLVSNTRLRFEEEVRPGRGHDVSWSINDGERLADGFLDVYGNGGYAVADLDLIHNGFDDECPCEHCVAYREDDGPDPTPDHQWQVTSGGRDHDAEHRAAWDESSEAHS